MDIEETSGSDTIIVIGTYLVHDFVFSPEVSIFPQWYLTIIASCYCSSLSSSSSSSLVARPIPKHLLGANASSLLAWVIHELNVAPLPVLLTDEHALEGDSVANRGEAEDDSSDLGGTLAHAVK